MLTLKPYGADAVLNTLYLSIFFYASLSFRQPKGDSSHQEEAGPSTLWVAVLSGPGGGGPGGEAEVRHCMQLWTIDPERWKFLVSPMETAWTCCHTLL